jgi:hypothetical protein
VFKFNNQQIFCPEDIESIRSYCNDSNTLCFGASVLYISCYQKNDELVVHAIMGCVVVSMSHSQGGLRLQLAAPLGDGNYIRMASSEMASISIALPISDVPVLAMADNRYVDVIRSYFSGSTDDAPGGSKPHLSLVKS